ncbi:DUF1569 domain-containing protein [Rufibacter latericius]|uniref:DUF1569 domain-containing protein n=1 Tax=Rufibacter latericius TaxID=2487040 RepID=A0A3M9MLD4_9BACT|nr:DUF1569 domain-containing protein [Rufibacter latericius]RNI25693.1 DUF1569 domain-containing protein [Rufibacter latericius]
MKNVFEQRDVAEVLARIDHLSPTSQPLWGKMTVAQMLAHCNVMYEMAFENIHAKPNPFMRLILKLLVKSKVVNEEPYQKNIRTAPQFLIKETKDFELEKSRLIDYIQKTRKLGKNYFEGKESLSFGKLNSQEWNNMFYKHLDHHLRQFGV